VVALCGREPGRPAGSAQGMRAGRPRSRDQTPSVRSRPGRRQPRAPSRERLRKPVLVGGADGRPIAGIRVFGHLKDSMKGEHVSRPELSFVHPQPGRPQTIVIVDENQSLGAFVDVKGDEADPIRVALRPVGTVTGRLVDEDHRARANVVLNVRYELKAPWDSSSGQLRRIIFHVDRFSDPVLTEPDGRFRIKGLVPGISCTVNPFNRISSNGSFRDGRHLHALRMDRQAR
jgi:hypothetical protein